MAESKTCKNCKASLDSKDHYCRSCGQNTTHLNLNLWHFITEFFNTIFNLDNRFFQTVIKLFIPAQLAIDFFAGIRKKYYHPFRIYFVSILMLFFIISMVNPKAGDVQNSPQQEIQNRDDISPMTDNDEVQDSTNSRFFKKNRTKKLGRSLVGFGDIGKSILLTRIIRDKAANYNNNSLKYTDFQ